MVSTPQLSYALCSAAARCSRDCVDLLLDRGADINFKGSRRLRNAVRIWFDNDGDTDSNAGDSEGEGSDEEREDNCHIKMVHRRLMVQLLMQRGAEVTKAVRSIAFESGNPSVNAYLDV